MERWLTKDEVESLFKKYPKFVEDYQKEVISKIDSETIKQMNMTAEGLLGMSLILSMRSLYEFFDNKGYYISIIFLSKFSYDIEIRDKKTERSHGYDTRQLAEKAAFLKIIELIYG